VLDGLPARCVGEWAYDKVFRLVKYFEIFARAMKNKWGGRLNYVEICSGPGRCIVRERGTEQDGTPLVIARHAASVHLASAVFVDYSPRVLEALEQRLGNVDSTGTPLVAVRGDYNHPDQLVGAIRPHLASHGLSFVMIDPTDCELPFDTVRALAEALDPADLLINFAINTDFNRQAQRVVLDSEGVLAKAEAKYERFLGTHGFFQRSEAIQAAEEHDHRELRKLFADEYEASLRRIGYEFFDSVLVRHYYRLLFASKNERGLDLWHKSARYDPKGQAKLPGLN